MLITPKEAALLPLLIFGFVHLNTVSCDNSDAAVRTQKHFSLFSVVTFANEECSSESTFNGGQLTGTCYTSTECSDKSGTKSGNCASGFGVCCIFIYNTLSDTTISENRTYLQNPLYPSTETSGAGTTTTYTINKMRDDICQLRFDFDYFVIAGPANTIEAQSALADGNCLDKFIVTLTSGATAPTLCGVMTGEHMYVDLGMETTDKATVALTLASTTLTASFTGILVANAFRKFRVKTSQIPCWATYRAPDGCHRYLTGPVGQVVSPNFADLTAGARGANLLNAKTDLMGQDLRTCIRREAGYCCIQYQVCNSFAGIELSRTAVGGALANGAASITSQGWSFHTFLDYAGDIGDGTKTAKDNDIGVVDGGCTTDYLEIPDSTTGVRSYSANVQSNSRYCGVRFGYIPALTQAVGNNNHAPVWDCTEPWELNYFTDNVNDNSLQASLVTLLAADVARGFCIDYDQHAC